MLNKLLPLDRVSQIIHHLSIIKARNQVIGIIIHLKMSFAITAEVEHLLVGVIDHFGRADILAVCCKA